MTCSKKGFTLIELMVVMAIIGILAAALIVPISKVGDTARAVRCKTNLRNLAQAALSYAVDSSPSGSGIKWGEHLPSAGTYEEWIPTDSGEALFNAHVGWVSGYYAGPFPWDGRIGPSTPVLKRGADDKASYAFFDENETRVYQSITNGVLWNYVGKDLSTYVCDAHKAVAKRARCKNVLRSYVMNAYFGCNLSSTYASDTAKTPPRRDGERRLNNLSSRGNAGALLMFAELPAYNASGAEDVKTDAGSADGILDMFISGYNNSSSEEIIGFNHRLAKRMIAHVAFADGHVDAIVAPDSPRLNDLRNLTALLCNGYEVSANKSDWERDRPKKSN